MPPSSSSQTALQVAAGLIAAGRATEAARELNALVRAAPTYAAAYVLLAKAREATGDRFRALDAWHRAYFLVPGSPLVRRERQRLLDRLVTPAPQTEEIAHLSPAANAPLATGQIVPEQDPDVDLPDLSPSATVLPPLVSRVEPAQKPPPEKQDGWLLGSTDDRNPLPPLDPIKTWAASEAEPVPENPDLDLTDGLAIPGVDGLDNDLDALIRDLEDAPRIRPDPNFEGPDVVSKEDGVEEIASETLAKIYEAQKQYDQAADVYEKLARQKPDRAAEMHLRAAEMRRRATQ